MHELSIAVSIVEVASQEAESRDLNVVAVRLRLGPLSGVVKEALLFSFEIARAGSRVENARLEIEEMPIKIFCEPCQAIRGVQSIQQVCCDECGAASSDIRSGRELEVAALEVQDAENPA
jgi:hydrogenase nickel incorporation protein HypA/HybF